MPVFTKMRFKRRLRYLNRVLAFVRVVADGDLLVVPAAVPLGGPLGRRLVAAQPNEASQSGRGPNAKSAERIAPVPGDCQSTYDLVEVLTFHSKPRLTLSNHC